MYSADEINAAIAQGRTVTACAADAERTGQPRRGREVELTQAWDAGWEIRATARGYKGRFRVERVAISGTTVADLQAEARA